MKFEALPTPCYVVDEALIEQNLQILHGIMERTGAHILLAQKAFSMHALYPLIAKYLCGATASGLYEARLGKSMGKENHVFAPAYRAEEFDEIAALCDHIVFNSFRQLALYKQAALTARCSIGIRINPEYSTQDHAIYDPCAPLSRLGVTLENFKSDELDGVEGLHFHTLCEQGADDLIRTWTAFEERFGTYLKSMKWMNLGGGHHITKPGYDIPALEELIRSIQKKYDVQVYLEPGEAIALNAGFFVTIVLETLHKAGENAIVDSSAACHMPDVLEMPYRPPLANSFFPNEKAHTYRIAGMTCLAGDVIGDYSFENPLIPGDRLVFEDMAIYSMVKNNTFNGMPLPAIALRGADGDCRIVKTFGYQDFYERLS
jgi:carboxynorspermidine decarboxylase